MCEGVCVCACVCVHVCVCVCVTGSGRGRENIKCNVHVSACLGNVFQAVQLLRSPILNTLALRMHASLTLFVVNCMLSGSLSNTLYTCIYGTGVQYDTAKAHTHTHTHTHIHIHMHTHTHTHTYHFASKNISSLQSTTKASEQSKLDGVPRTQTSRLLLSYYNYTAVEATALLFVQQHVKGAIIVDPASWQKMAAM